MKRKFQAFWDMFFCGESREVEEAEEIYGLVFEFLFEPCHNFGVSDEEEDKGDDGALLSHPESEWGGADFREVLI